MGNFDQLQKQTIQRGYSELPVCPEGQQRAHSSQRASVTAWWPPPQPACGGWTASAEAWPDGASEARAGPRGCKADCQSGRGWWPTRASPEPDHSWLLHPGNGHRHWTVHPLPHCSEREKGPLERFHLLAKEGKQSQSGSIGFYKK